MKVTNWRRKLAATLAAGGLLSPAMAAELDMNLVVNPGFENVDVSVSEGGYNAVQILDWNDGTVNAFAYSHDGSLNSGGDAIPDYANGGIYTGGAAPAGGGSFYFTPNATPGDITAPGQFAQDIDLSTGATGDLIPTGEAAVTVSAIFSSFSTNGDFGTVHVDLLDSGGASLRTVEVSDTDVTMWTANSAAGLIPVGTATARVSLFGTPLSGGPDGYMDLIDVQVTSAENFLMFLEVNTSTGVATLKNNTGEAINIDYYEVTSAAGSLDAAAWNSLQDQNLSGFPAGNGSGNGWEESGGADSEVVAESYLTGNSAVANQGTVNLGALFDSGEPQDLVFRYAVVADDGGGGSLAGDFDSDGDADGADFLQWQRSFPDTLDADDLANWESDFGSGGGPSGPGVLTTGFVRYVTSGAAAVPEPTSILLVGAGVALFAASSRKRQHGR